LIFLKQGRVRGAEAYVCPPYFQNFKHIFEFMKPTTLRTVYSALLLLGIWLQCSAQNLTYKVYKRDGDTYYLGKVLVPKSGKYKMKRNPTADTTVELFFGHVDTNKNRIYMMNMVVTEGYYYIDATSCSHGFVVRTNTPDDVVLEPATAADEDVIVANDSFWFDLVFGRQNKLRFNSTMVANSVLQENATYKTKNIYVMANPALRGLAFAWLDQYGTSRNLPANSLYVLGKQTASAPELEVIWPDDETENVTGIETLGQTRQSDDIICNLHGQRVTDMQKGHIYIRNGRKFVAR